MGAEELGETLILKEGDAKEDRSIIRCTGEDRGCCIAGSGVLPTYKEHYDSAGNYKEYVDLVRSNEEWVIAKTILVKEIESRYWLIKKSSLKSLNCKFIDCDSIVLENRFGPYDLREFIKEKEYRNINLKFN